MNGGRVITNECVVPYNAFLSVKYNCHINVEVCTSLGAIKYLFKYIYKGPDQLRAELRRSAASASDGAPVAQPVTRRPVDEVAQYLDGRYVGPPEAVWRLNAFDLYNKSHTVVRLDLHLPNLQRVVHDGTANGAQQALERNRSTTLTRYFEVVRDETLRPLPEAALLGGPPAPDLSYTDFPLWYRWDNSQRKWRRRRLRAYQVTSRMITAHPREGERFYLRTLLNVVVGASSYEALRTVDGEVCATFREACDHLGLLDDDAEWRRCLAQAAETEVPSLLRRLFVYIVAENGPAEPLALWTEFQNALADDFAHDRCQIAHDEVRAVDDSRQSQGIA